MQAAACVGLLLMTVNVPIGLAQQTQPETQPSPTRPAPPQPVQNDTTGQAGLPQAPTPKPTEPLYLRDTSKNYLLPKSHFWNPIAPYTPTNVPKPDFENTPKLDSLLRDGKIYLSLSDAVLLALEEQLRYRDRAYQPRHRRHGHSARESRRSLRGVSTGLVTKRLGSSGTTVTCGGGPGGTSSGAGGGGTGANGLVLSTNGGGLLPENLDPVLTGHAAVRERRPSSRPIRCLPAATVDSPTDTATYDFGYQQGFVTGTPLNVTFNNSRVPTTNPFELQSAG